MASSDDGSSKRQPISRQTSIYSLTLDEFQNALGEPGKNFGSMNMDEFLKNIWTAEESQAMAAAMGGEAGTSNLFRQPSVANLPQTLTTKTVDEVWKDIYKSSTDAAHKAERQMTLGEMTLEDFLIKAGVVRDDNKEAVEASKPSRGRKQQPDYQQYAAMAQQQQQQQQFMQQQAEVAAYLTGAKALPNGGLAAPNAALAGNLGIGLGNGFGGGSPSSPGSDSQGNGFGLGFGFDGRGRKRGLEGPVEVVIQRRQRRMIKNRESAARSRARKQAYTVELEAEVSNLKEENMRLKKLQEEAELRARKRSQMLEVIVAKSEASLAKPRPLRRTLTLPW